MDTDVVYSLSATEAQLRTLHGVDETRAASILEARSQEVLDFWRLAAVTGMNVGQWQAWHAQGRISLEMVPVSTDRTTVETSRCDTSSHSKMRSATWRDNCNPKEVAAKRYNFMSTQPSSHHRSSGGDRPGTELHVADTLSAVEPPLVVIRSALAPIPWA